MPKLVDHEARRREIAEAMWRVIARDGMAGASARSIAAETGWSLGAVRHYFPDRDTLLRFAAQAMLDGITARIRDLFATQPPGEPRACAAIEQLLPLDTRRIGEVRAWLAVLVGPDDAVLRSVRDEAWEGSRALARTVIEDLGGDPDDEVEAARVHAWIDGLTLQAITVPHRYPPDRLRDEVRQWVALTRVSMV